MKFRSLWSSRSKYLLQDIILYILFNICAQTHDYVHPTGILFLNFIRTQILYKLKWHLNTNTVQE